MAFNRDKLLLAFGILSLFIGIVWSIIFEMVMSETPEYPVSLSEVIAGSLLSITGILLLYQKGRSIFYSVVATSLIASLVYLWIAPYIEDYVVGAFCLVVLFIAVLKRDSFETKPLMSRIVAILMHSGRLKVSDLAAQLEKPEADVELALIKLRSSGATIEFEPETREVVYYA